jgi:N-acetylmuramoyl-L-alanine amidase
VIAPALDLTHTTRWWGERLLEARMGVMLHYDQSASDASGLGWLLRSPKAKVSYNRYVTRSGVLVQIAPDDRPAWHSGNCRPSDPRRKYSHGNSAFYGVCAALHDEGLGGHREHASAEQLDLVVASCVEYFRAHGWAARDVEWRITGHADEAWPRGRRRDPYGFDPAAPVLCMETVRDRVAVELLTAGRAPRPTLAVPTWRAAALPHPEPRP